MAAAWLTLDRCRIAGLLQDYSNNCTELLPHQCSSCSYRCFFISHEILSILMASVHVVALNDHLRGHMWRLKPLKASSKHTNTQTHMHTHAPRSVILKLLSWSGGFKRVRYEALHQLHYPLRLCEAPTICKAVSLSLPRCLPAVWSPGGFLKWAQHLKMQITKRWSQVCMKSMRNIHGRAAKSRQNQKNTDKTVIQQWNNAVESKDVCVRVVGGCTSVFSSADTSSAPSHAKKF